MTTTPEPKDKLDTTTTQQATLSVGVVVVNGPEDDILDWYAIDWPTAEDDVRRLRQRIWPWKSGRRRSGTFCRPGEHRRPRDTGGTHPGRGSCVGNVVTPSGSGRSGCVRCEPPRWMRMSASSWARLRGFDDGPVPGFGAGPWWSC